MKGESLQIRAIREIGGLLEANLNCVDLRHLRLSSPRLRTPATSARALPVNAKRTGAWHRPA